jgi:CubicO group peptidase (beta-lactamase class C family)
MSAGWPQDDPWADRQLYRDDASISDLYREGVSFSNPPGATYEYSNYGYMVLGRIITQAAGEPAIDYITREFLQPLGMTSTTWHPDAVPETHRACGYRWEDQTWRQEQPLPSGGDVAAFAGLHSTVRDLARWVGLFQAAWPPRSAEETGPLARASLREMQRIWRSYPPILHTAVIGSAPQVSGGGYGYGLSMIHHGQWQSAGHAGGLPGFGSHMRWVPDHGVGVIALANVTYANVHDACLSALETLVRTSASRPRTVVLTPPLKSAHDDLVQLLNAWDDPLADRLFADNFFLDLDRDHWRSRCQQLRDAHGKLRPEQDVQPSNWLRGTRRLRGERGWCDVWATLSPTVPPRVQMLRVHSVLPPSDSLQRAADRVVKLTAKPIRHELDRLLAPECDREDAWKQLQLANLMYGHCTIKEIESGDGVSQAVFRLEGCGREILLTLRTHDQNQLVSLKLTPAEPGRHTQRYH